MIFPLVIDNALQSRGFSNQSLFHVEMLSLVARTASLMDKRQVIKRNVASHCALALNSNASTLAHTTASSITLLVAILKTISSSFGFGYFRVDAHININDKNLALWEPIKKLIFVVQRFRERLGIYFTVRIISPSAPKLRKFSYSLSYSVWTDT